MAGKKKLAVIRVADPKTGPSREAYEALCKALGLKPQPPKSPIPDAH
jgi:hypothetical protein